MTCLNHSVIYYNPNIHKFVFTKNKKLLMDASLVYFFPKLYNFMMRKFYSLHHFPVWKCSPELSLSKEKDKQTQQEKCEKQSPLQSSFIF